MPQTLSQQELVERLRELRLRVTPQRLDVHAALVALGRHATPDEVFAWVRGRHPSISLNTVHATLDTLWRAGAVRRGDLEAGPRRYDANVAPHHHLVCRGCGDQADVEFEIPLDGAATALAADRGFAIDTLHVTFYGLCESCSRALPAGLEAQDAVAT